MRVHCPVRLYLALVDCVDSTSDPADHFRSTPAGSGELCKCPTFTALSQLHLTGFLPACQNNRYVLKTKKKKKKILFCPLGSFTPGLRLGWDEVQDRFCGLPSSFLLSGFLMHHLLNVAVIYLNVTSWHPLLPRAALSLAISHGCCATETLTSVVLSRHFAYVRRCGSPRLAPSSGFCCLHAECVALQLLISVIEVWRSWGEEGMMRKLAYWYLAGAFCRVAPQVLLLCSLLRSLLSVCLCIPQLLISPRSSKPGASPSVTSRWCARHVNLQVGQQPTRGGWTLARQGSGRGKTDRGASPQPGTLKPSGKTWVPSSQHARWWSAAAVCGFLMLCIGEVKLLTDGGPRWHWCCSEKGQFAWMKSHLKKKFCEIVAKWHDGNIAYQFA